jgi:hypothetical protein
MAINPANITTIRVGELPTGTITLTSNIPVENVTDLEKITGQDLVDFININSNAFQFELRDLFVNQTYIDDNFDITGLGTDLMLGWAICNGQNGTPNMDGLVSIGYGTNYNVINAIGGSKNAVVVEHSHQGLFVSGSNRDNGDPGNYIITANGEPNGIQSSTLTYTANAGVSGLNKNMQPYRVLLKIMKL